MAAGISRPAVACRETPEGGIGRRHEPTKPAASCACAELFAETPVNHGRARAPSCLAVDELPGDARALTGRMNPYPNWVDPGGLKMFKRILVPTDLTDRTLKALNIALKIAVHDGASITLLHVIETIEDTEEDFSGFYSKLGKAAEKKMNGIIEDFRVDGPPIAKEIIYGKRVREIIRFAGEKEIDLIVLSSHRVDVDNAVQGWGTISYKVGILSQCPVLLVK